MESPTRIPQTLSPCSSGRSRLSTDSNSPEFEFWRLQDPSQQLPQSPDLLSADELFSGGVLLPLSLLSLSHPDSEPGPHPGTPRHHEPEQEPPSSSLVDEAKPSEEAQVAAEAGPPTASKRWRDIFKKAEKKPEEGRERLEKKKKEKRGQGGSGSPELNINIWPFSRSRSAGNCGSRPRAAAAGARKVSSAPCSRSNSAGESKSRKWPSSPGRAGVHLGRSSPVWQVRRASSGGPKSSDPIPQSTDKGASNKEAVADGARRSQAAGGSSRWGGRAVGGGAKARVLNLNVPMCIGYRQHLSCRGGDSSAIAVDAGSEAKGAVVGAVVEGGRSGGEGIVGGGSGSNNLFNLKSLFTKKVY